MNNTIKSIRLLTMLSVCSLFSSCANDEEIIVEPKAELPADLITQEPLSEAITVKVAREQNEPGNTLILEGFVGGRENPFVDGRAIFVFGDDSLETCDNIPGDACKTPWDACCENPKNIKAATITIQVVDENNEVVKGTLNGVGGIKAGGRLKIMGQVAKNSSTEAMILNAQTIKLL
jgi:hypothetical protein|tara:strand:- start:1463 stop:1993 length:531 start_codon:yes stop_codon:yes gene_type:complete